MRHSFLREWRRRGVSDPNEDLRVLVMSGRDVANGRDAPSPTSTKSARTTYVTERQATVHALYVRHECMSAVARMMGVSQITVRETLVQYQRNKLRDRGVSPPPLKAMLRGSVITRFGVERRTGRPAIHEAVDYQNATAATTGRITAAPTSAPVVQDDPTEAVRIVFKPHPGRVRRLIVTSVEGGAPLHHAFLANLRTYADRLGAELMVYHVGRGAIDRDVSGMISSCRLTVGEQVDIVPDAAIPLRTGRPLAGLHAPLGAVWTVFPHPTLQVETMPRIRADGLRVQLTTGAATKPRAVGEHGGRDELGALIVEVSPDGVAHCRHLLTPIGGDGSFQDMTMRVQDGRIKTGCGVEAINFGDIHHSQMDDAIAAKTWGEGSSSGAVRPLVDRLRPRRQIFHDVCDFSARSPFDARDHHRRFAQFLSGGGDVGAEMARTAAFLASTSRPWSTSIVVASNHDAMFREWLMQADFREDPTNALFFLRSSLALHERIARDDAIDGFFEETLRGLVPCALPGVRFLKCGEGLKVAGVEVGIHGDKGPDGRRGGMQGMERLGIRATIGHTHRPTTRGGLWSSGVCQTDLDYAKGPLTSWAAGHVVTYWNGARTHLFFHDGRFHA